MAKDNWPFRLSRNNWGYELRLGGLGGGKKKKRQGGVEKKEPTPPTAGTAIETGQGLITPKKKKKQHMQPPAKKAKTNQGGGKNKKAKGATTGAPTENLRFDLDAAARAKVEQEMVAKLNEKEKQQQKEDARLQKEREDVIRLKKIFQENDEERERVERVRATEFEDLKDELQNEMKTLKEARRKAETDAREAKAAEEKRAKEADRALEEVRKKKIELQELLESKLNDQTEENNQAESEGQQASQDDEGRDETPPRRQEEEENRGRNDLQLQELTDVLKGAFASLKRAPGGDASTNSSSKSRIAKAYDRQECLPVVKSVQVVSNWIRTFTARCKNLEENESWQIFQEISENLVRGGSTVARDIHFEDEGITGCLARWAEEVLPTANNAQGDGDLSSLCEKQWLEAKWTDPLSSDYGNRVKSILFLWEMAVTNTNAICRVPELRQQIEVVAGKWKEAATKAGMENALRRDALRSMNGNSLKEALQSLVRAGETWKADEAKEAETLYGSHGAAGKRKRGSERCKYGNDCRKRRCTLRHPRGLATVNSTTVHSSSESSSDESDGGRGRKRKRTEREESSPDTNKLLKLVAETTTQLLSNAKNSSETTKSSAPCWPFQKGACHQKNCIFQHVIVPETRVCWAFKEGKCNFPNCRFLHLEGTRRGQGTDWRERRGPQDDRKGERKSPCYHWNRNKCRFHESRCRGAHVCSECRGNHTKEEHGGRRRQVNETVMQLGVNETNEEQLLAVTEGLIGSTRVTIKWDSFCVGLDGQISEQLARELRNKGSATIQKKIQTIRYGNGTQTSSKGVATLYLRVKDGEDDAQFKLRLQILEGTKQPIIVGWNTIERARVDLTSDKRYILIPTSMKTLKLQKLSMREWARRERYDDEETLATLNMMVEGPLRNRETLFGCSPTSSTSK
jgi:hypothetical protein